MLRKIAFRNDRYPLNMQDETKEFVKTVSIHNHFKKENFNEFRIGKWCGDILLDIHNVPSEKLTIDINGEILCKNPKAFPKIPLLLIAYGETTIQTPSDIKTLMCRMKFIPQSKRVNLIKRSMEGEIFIDKTHFIIYQDGWAKRVILSEYTDIESL